nr:L-rhamnose operon transcriptional activator RhaR [Raoultella sp. NCTC 9187]
MLIKAEHLVRYQNPAITVEQLAAALNLTPRHAESPNDRADSGKARKTSSRGFRIETASLLLESPDQTVSQVASACGYGDETAFRRAFSRIMGMSPGNYRERVKTNS